MNARTLTYYCPAGCNVFETTTRNPECAACGRIMTTDPARFDEVHGRKEVEGIARIEAETKARRDV